MNEILGSVRASLLLAILICSILSSCRIHADDFSAHFAENASTPMPRIEIIPKPRFNSDLTLKVGIVDVDDNQMICFRTKNSGLAKGAPISIVASLYQFPQKVLQASVERKLEKSCVSDDADAGEANPGEDHYYSLILVEPKFDKSYIGIAIGVVQPVKKIEVKNKLASVDLNGDGKLEFFRLCASNEGLHLTIWTGQPLRGKRIWHSYYYLHYDTEADCKKKDWEGTDGDDELE